MDNYFWDEPTDEPSIFDLSEPSNSGRLSTYSKGSIYHCAQSYLLPGGDQIPSDDLYENLVGVQCRPAVVKVERANDDKRAIKQGLNRSYHASRHKIRTQSN